MSLAAVVICGWRVRRCGGGSGGAADQADNCILHYYNWLGGIARQIARARPHQHRLVKDYAAAFKSAGGDELIFIRATASPGQLELLAGAVLWHSGLPRVHGLVNGLG